MYFAAMLRCVGFVPDLGYDQCPHIYIYIQYIYLYLYDRYYKPIFLAHSTYIVVRTIM